MISDPVANPAPDGIYWRVHLFDGPVLVAAGGAEVRRFRFHKAGALLAYLALRLGRPCPREELYEVLWPEEDPHVVANRFRVTLASLRRQLEPAPLAYGTVLDVSEPGRVCLRVETVWCDAVACERAARAGRAGEAAHLLCGPLLPGYYEEWASQAREHFAALAGNLQTVQADRAGTQVASDPSDDVNSPLETTAVARLDAADSAAPAAAGVETAEPLPETISLCLSASLEESSSRAFLSLPLYLTRCFGREAETRQLVALVEQHRLMCITGAGGMGKTRLATETAPQIGLNSVFVALSDVTEENRVEEAVLRALRVSPASYADLGEQLIALLARRGAMLLILDNAEHLLEGIADLCLRLLSACPHLKILATSRQRLNVAGEAILPLSPLPAPPAHAPFAQIADMSTVALFVDRARLARPDWVLLPRHTDAVLHICRLLEGVPLALELAAARISAQTPSQIADELEVGLLTLKSRLRGVSARHRSLRAAIQGSFDLLAPPLQTFLARLSVFQGGWTPEAARMVTDCAQASAFLEELAAHSLSVLREAEGGEGMRGVFLESIRQFAAEQLTDAERPTLERRHADYFLSLAAAVDEEDARTLHPLEAEQENLLRALQTGWEWTLPMLGEGLRGALLYGYMRGQQRVFLPWVERALEIAPRLPDSRLRVRLRVWCFQMLSYVGEVERGRSVGQQMEAEAQRDQDGYGQAEADLILSYVANRDGGWEAALQYSERALQQARRQGDTGLLCRCLRVRAWLLLAWTWSGADPGTQAVAVTLAESERLSRECLRVMPPQIMRGGMAHLTLASALRKTGRSAEAYQQVKAAQRFALAQGDQPTLSYCLQEESRAALAGGRCEYAAMLYGAFLEAQDRTGYLSEKVPADTLPAETLLPETNQDAAQNVHDKRDVHIERELIRQVGRERLDALIQMGRRLPPQRLAVFSLDNLPVVEATDGDSA